MPKTPPTIHEPEIVALSELKGHERNYRGHPPDQVAHLTRSIEEHGFYRNVVVANDGTILAGHGVVEAAHEAGLTEVPVIRLPIGPDDPRALKILTGDNELARLAEIDDRLLSELLREIREDDTLLGTGYDDQMLASLLFVTRPASEIADHDAAAQWIGIPEYEGIPRPLQIVVAFANEQHREEFMQLIGATVVQFKSGRTWSIWWPEHEIDNPAALRFEDETQSADA